MCVVAIVTRYVYVPIKNMSQMETWKYELKIIYTMIAQILLNLIILAGYVFENLYWINIIKFLTTNKLRLSQRKYLKEIQKMIFFFHNWFCQKNTKKKKNQI